jgi:hypothetical protein
VIPPLAETGDVFDLKRAVEEAIQKHDRMILVTSDPIHSYCSVRVCNAETVKLDEFLNYVSFILWRLLRVAGEVFPDCGIDVPTLATAMGDIVADATELHSKKQYNKPATKHSIYPKGFTLLLNPKEIGALQHLFERVAEEGILTPTAVAALQNPIKQVSNISRKIRDDFVTYKKDETAKIREVIPR